MDTDPTRALETHLEEEQRLLIRGEIESLALVSDRKQSALDALEGAGDLDAETIRQIQKLARRNMTMIEAALRGVRSARQRVEEIRRVSTNLDTYSSSGTMENLGDAPRKVERRA